MDTPNPITDSVELVRRLDSDEIRARIAALDEERQALVVLLRAALRRSRTPVRAEVAARA
jgi:hypothetical protein